MKSNSCYNAFSRPVDDFFKSNPPFPLHVFSKSITGRIIGSNEQQLSYCGVKDIAEIRGLFLHELISDRKCTDAIFTNDELVTKQKVPMFFLEPRGQEQFLSIKTCLYDSSNNLSGTFGLGFYLDSTPLSQVLEYLNKLQLFISPQCLSSLMVQPSVANNLTSREKECVAYLIKGYSAKAIGQALAISSRTVEKHLEHIKNKLGCRSKVQLIAKLLEERS